MDRISINMTEREGEGLFSNFICAPLRVSATFILQQLLSLFLIQVREETRIVITHDCLLLCISFMPTTATQIFRFFFLSGKQTNTRLSYVVGTMSCGFRVVIAVNVCLHIFLFNNNNDTLVQRVLMDPTNNNKLCADIVHHSPHW